MNYKEFFYFQKSDRSVLVVLLVLAVVISVLLYGIGGTEETTDSETIPKFVQIDSRDTAYIVVRDGKTEIDGKRDLFDKTESYYVEGEKVERFPFDPNTADSTQLLRLGLRPWQVRSIYRYRSKGGVYREPKDFARLYGLTVKQYRELEPYIKISSDYLPAASLFLHDRQTKPRKDTTLTRTFPAKLKEHERINLAEADTTTLKKVPGIGSYYAKEIVRYGERLGGYVDVKQLYEIEDLPEEVMKYFEIRRMNVRKMNLNKMTLRQMKSHPYLNFYQCRAILDYRRLKGALTSMEQLRLMKEFSSKDIERLQPYVEFESSIGK